MNITDVQAHVLAIPMAPGKQKMPWTWGNFNQVLISVHTDTGLTGYGEAFGYGVPQATASVVDEILKPMLVGADATQITVLQDRMFRHTHLFGRYGVTNFAISGIDIALWDLAGKSAGLPLYRLLGGAAATEVPAYASLVRYAATEHVSEAVAQARDEGYEAIKLHQIDAESVEVARDAAGDDILLMLDVNCSWAPDEALDIALQCGPYELYWLEEPIWPPEDFEALAYLQQASETPIATGENACTIYQFQQMIESGCASFVQPSVTKVGGVSEWRKVAALAEARNIQVAAHSPYFGPGLLATAHLVAATPHAPWLEVLYAPQEASVFTEEPQVVDGMFAVPQAPGLGLEIDLDVLSRYRVA